MNYYNNTEELEFNKINDRSWMDEEPDEKPHYAKSGEFVTKHGVVMRAIVKKEHDATVRFFVRVSEHE